jgi:hypothetical protein
MKSKKPPLNPNYVVLGLIGAITFIVIAYMVLNRKGETTMHIKFLGGGMGIQTKSETTVNDTTLHL